MVISTKEIRRDENWPRQGEVTLGIIIPISIYFGRTIAFTILGLTLIPIIYVHGFLLPKKGINGWTGEPKSKYYDYRGWDKNIFGDKKK